MQEIPSLSIRFCLDIQQKPGDSTCEVELVKRFVYQFGQAQWPSGVRLPDIFYFPASLSPDRKTRAALRAKCVVVDRAPSFLGSANFTDATQARNIEIGVVINSCELTGCITRFLTH